MVDVIDKMIRQRARLTQDIADTKSLIANLDSERRKATIRLIKMEGVLEYINDMIRTNKESTEGVIND